MGYTTRALWGSILHDRYAVAEFSRESEATTFFRGMDTRIGCPVEIEVLHAGIGAASPEACALRARAMQSSRVRHPNVVTPRDMGVLDDGTPFVVTARFDGVTLEEHLCLSGSLSVADVVRVGCEILSAMVAAHAEDIVHGALRPDSIFLVERGGALMNVMVSGFGGEAGVDDQTPLGFMTTPFLAPERLAGGAPSAAADVYAVGALLFLAATGFPPSGAGVQSLPSLARGDLPARLVHVLLQALAPHPGRRFADAAEMLAALRLVRVSPMRVVRKNDAAPPTVRDSAVIVASSRVIPCAVYLDDEAMPETVRAA